ncbi:MAG: methionine gamma-lyase family protein [Oscillospiraceae bacterium]|jgi:cystathionine beta-lyase family protein involved in aluminum resistance|nr:methionine gamma-lyase family protein [Oscillospiraceae bacterium]
MDMPNKIRELAAQTMFDVAPRFAEIDDVAEENTRRVLGAFRNHRVSEAHFAGTTGYGYDDKGRETLDKVYAEVFGAEKALVRTGFVNGTHAITASLFGALRPGDTLLSVTGAPYDTIRTAIGISGEARGSLREWGVNYRQVDIHADENIWHSTIREAMADKTVTTVFIQRSRGYSEREALSVKEIAEVAEVVHTCNRDAAVIVDNCYGEFTEICEPSAVGADLIAGSLIKNPGGGLAPCGGYIAGRADLVDSAAARLTSPGIGGECGATLGANRALFQGFFMAPHTTAQALKTAVFCARLFEKAGFEVSPSWDAPRSDIIQSVKLGSAALVRKFCAGIQAASPVDSFVTPVPWAMPGYDCDVIMAAGAFVSGASIELSADAPMREPYTVYLQGGLTFEAGKLGIMSALSSMSDK